jgi:uncharacterized protein (DUF2147 family)
MKKMYLFCLLFVSILSFSGQGFASSINQIKGIWLTENKRAKVEIYNCAGNAETLCGKIVWLLEPNDDKGNPKIDQENPEESLKNRPLFGLEILKGFTPVEDSPGSWENGSIYDPKEGKTYRCTMDLQEDGTLEIRGYVGIPLFGKTQVWTRSNL